MESKIDVGRFKSENLYQRGKPLWFEIAWYFVKMTFFLSAFPWPSRIRCYWLKVFGATVGEGVYIKPRVNVHMPWRLKLGRNALVGEEACIMNFEQVDIGANACLSQRAFICSGSHDYRSKSFSYRHAPIVIRDGAWIGAQAFVGPGVVVGVDAVLTASAMTSADVPDGDIYGGNPARYIRKRWKEEL